LLPARSTVGACRTSFRSDPFGEGSRKANAGGEPEASGNMPRYVRLAITSMNPPRRHAARSARL